MTTTRPLPLGAIVVGMDGSTSAYQALDWAAEQAELEHRPLVLVHATGPVHPLAAIHEDRRKAALLDLSLRGHELLRRAAGRSGRRHPDLEIRTSLVTGDPRQALLDVADGARLMVGSRGLGVIRSLLLGSVGQWVSRRCSCPLVVVRPQHPGLERHGVLVGTDAGPRSRATLEFAYRQASSRALPLTVLHCAWDVVGTGIGSYVGPSTTISLEDAQRSVAESVAGLAEKFPDVHVTLEVSRGLADACLLQACESTDLLVVGRHDSDALTRVLMGNVADRVVEHATCVVAVVPS